MEKPNILFLVIDSLRADKIFGKKKTSITPNIDKIVKNGVLFSNVVSSAQSSIPAVSSIFTGKYPFSTLKLEDKVYNLKKDCITFIQKLKDENYQVHATIPKILTLMNLDHIFEKNIYAYDDNLTLYDGVGQKIIHQINNFEKSKPWFFYLHLNDIHGHAKFHKNIIPNGFEDKKNGANQYERMISLMDIWLGKIFDKIDLSTTMIIITADHATNMGVYDEKLDETFRQEKEFIKVEKNQLVSYGQKFSKKLPSTFKPLRRKLSQIYKDNRDLKINEKASERISEIEKLETTQYKKRILKNMVKAMSELYDDRLIIPFVLTGVNSHQIISQQVRSIDIFPTIFDILNLEINFKIHGRSLLPLIKRQNFDELPAFIETHTNVIEGFYEHYIGIRTSNFKYFRKIDEPINEFLFDLKKDPLEEENIAKLNKDKIQKMNNLIDEILKDI